MSNSAISGSGDFPPNIAEDRAVAPPALPVRLPKPKQARAGEPWWGVIGADAQRGDSYHGPIYRHPTRETAESEAAYMATLRPGRRYTVIEAVSFHGGSEVQP